ncbi:MAG: ABC transporter ATP-binding protein [Desulfurococcaceae archaeon]
MLEVKGLVAGYGKMVVLHGIDLAVQQKEIVAVLGPNGAGKSTLFNSIFGIATLHAGIVKFGDVVLNGRRPHEIVRLGLSYAPQTNNVFPNLSVIENLLMGAYYREDGDVERDVEELLELFPEIARRRHQKARTLSGGERQMLAVARALMSRPRLLLLDEPTAGLSPKAAAQLIRKVAEIRDRGVSVMLAEQNVRRALEIADRVYVIVGGRIVGHFRGDEARAEDVEKLFFSRT